MASRANIGADELYIGKAYLPGANPGNRRGVRQTPSRFVDLGALPAALSDGVISAATSTELPSSAGTVTYTAAADGTAPQDGSTRPTKVTLSVGGVDYSVLDLGGADYIGRNLVTVATHGTSIVALTVKHYGFDIYKQPMTETHSITATGTTKTATGKKAFRYWWKTEITAAADASANTLSVGTGVLVGVPLRIATKNAVTAKMDGVVETSATIVVADDTAATGTTGDVRGTVSFGSAPNGTRVYSMKIDVPDTSSGALVFGVAQA